MNKIEVVNDIVTSTDLDDSVVYEFIPKNELFDVNDIKLKIAKDTDLIIDYTSTKENKLDIFITVDKNVMFNLYEFRNGAYTKIQYKVYIDENAKMYVDKFYDVEKIKEMSIINLNGLNSTYDHNFKTICSSFEKYDIVVYHNNKQTKSNIVNNGINIQNGELHFNISSFIPKGKIECNANQSSRIINLTNNKCNINPNLYIDEYDVIANHAAHIGKFNNDELFYLMSRGITLEDATNLLIKGFLLNNTKHQEKIEESIKKYWR